MTALISMKCRFERSCIRAASSGPQLKTHINHPQNTWNLRGQGPSSWGRVYKRGPTSVRCPAGLSPTAPCSMGDACDEAPQHAAVRYLRVSFVASPRYRESPELEAGEAPATLAQPLDACTLML